MKALRLVSIGIALLIIQACSHPIEIVGQGDVTSASGNRNCSLEQFTAGDDVCDRNYVIYAYNETYYATPRAGWKFDHWVTYCQSATPPNYDCSFNVPAEVVYQYWGQTMPPLRAVFTPISGGTPITDTVTANGKIWAQVDLFTNLSSNQINAVCPDGACTANAVLNGYDMTGWRWATLADVSSLLSSYGGGLNLPLNFPSGVGTINSVWAPAFFSAGWRPTTTTTFERQTWGLFRPVNPDPQYASAAVMLDVVGDPGLVREDTASTSSFGIFRSNGQPNIGAWIYRPL